MCDPVSIGLTLVGGLYMQHQQRSQMADAQDQQNKANEIAVAQATKVAADNKAAMEAVQAQGKTAVDTQAAKQPNLYDISNKNMNDTKGGISSTTLTGPQGVDSKKLLLGKSTLLGGG